MPNSSLNSDSCVCSKVCRPCDLARTVAIRLQSSRIYFSQFRPNKLGPSPATTTSTRGEVCPLHSTWTLSCPIICIGSSVYVFKMSLDLCSFFLGNIFLRVTSEMIDTAAPVSNSMVSGLSSTLTVTSIGFEEGSFSLNK